MHIREGGHGYRDGRVFDVILVHVGGARDQSASIMLADPYYYMSGELICIIFRATKQRHIQ